MCDSRLVPTSQCTGGGISEGSSLAGKRILHLFKPWRLPVGTRLGRQREACQSSAGCQSVGGGSEPSLMMLA